MRPCSRMGTSSPHLARASSSSTLMEGVSSQWVTIITGLSRKMAASVSWLSTSMLPVEAPMKILMPQDCLGSSFLISSRLSLVAPR
ncbi:hypothetical protein D3C72_1260620 [compost metagenome]